MARRVVETVLKVSGDAEAQTRRAAKAMDSLRDSTAKAVNAAGRLSAGILATGAAILGLADQVARAVDEVNTLAGSSGLANETVNGLRLAAEATGKSLSAIVPKDLPKRLAEMSKGGGESKIAFDALGVAVFEADGSMRDADAVFRDVIKGLGELDSKTERAAIAQIALGRAGKEIVTAFGDLSGMERFIALGNEFGFKTGDAATEKMGQFQAATANTRLAIEDLAQTMLDLIDVEKVNKWVNNFAVGLVFITTAFRGAFIEIGAIWSRTMNTLIDNFQTLGKIVKSALSLDFAGAQSAAGGFKDIRDVLSDIVVDEIFGDAFNRAQRFSGLALAGSSKGELVPDPIPKRTGSITSTVKSSGGGPSFIGFGAEANALVGVVDEFAVTMTSIEQGIVDALDSIVSPAEAIEGIHSTISGGLVGILSALGPAGAIAGAVIGLLQDLPGLVTALVEEIANLPLVVVELLKSLPDIIATLLSEVLPEVLRNVPIIIEELTEAIPDIVIAIVEALPAIINALILIIPRLIAAGIENLIRLFTELPMRLAEAVKNALTPNTEVIGDFGRSIKQFLGFETKAGRSSPLAGLPGFAHGTKHVSQTGLALLHEGETVTTEASQRRMRSQAGIPSGGGYDPAGVRCPQCTRDFIREMGIFQGLHGDTLSAVD